MTEPLTQDIPIMIPLNEASRLTGLSYDWLRKKCLRGEIIHIRVGDRKTKILINYSKLLDYLNTGDQEKCEDGDAYD